jgi:hypothetical protein
MDFLKSVRHTISMVVRERSGALKTRIFIGSGYAKPEWGDVNIALDQNLQSKRR